MIRILFLLFFCLFAQSSYAAELPAMSLQNAVTPVMHEIHKLHSIMFFTMLAVAVIVCLVLLYTIFKFHHTRNPVPAKFSHNVPLEIVWTAIPLIIVLILSVFSVKALYVQDEQKHFDLTLKVVGHQWYWTYEYPEYELKFDSYLKQDKDLQPGDKRLLSVDNVIVVPKDKNVRVIITADDVIHSWAVPAFGVKRDAVPGRLNETWFRAEKEGTFYGQCSELCGALHGFMPIAVKVVSEEEFSKWAKDNKEKFSA